MKTEVFYPGEDVSVTYLNLPIRFIIGDRYIKYLAGVGSPKLRYRVEDVLFEEIDGGLVQTVYLSDW